MKAIMILFLVLVLAVVSSIFAAQKDKPVFDTIPAIDTVGVVAIDNHLSDLWCIVITHSSGVRPKSIINEAYSKAMKKMVDYVFDSVSFRILEEDDRNPRYIVLRHTFQKGIHTYVVEWRFPVALKKIDP